MRNADFGFRKKAEPQPADFRIHVTNGRLQSHLLPHQEEGEHDHEQGQGNGATYDTDEQNSNGIHNISPFSQKQKSPSPIQDEGARGATWVFRSRLANAGNELSTR
jgi:hypothetical protein